MTRINTNVSSLNAQKSLARSNASLQESLTRLSTGLRINTGKDDPAGLIASEVLRSDIISVERAITNSERANQMISIADSALGQVSGLLNDIRGLVTEAANTGALSDEQIAANQLVVDSSLESLNRIAQTTSFQGRRLLDGSLDFITSATANFDDITDLEINQANLGSAGSIDVEIDISAAATQAQITNNVSPDTSANATLSFAAGTTLGLANGTLTIRANSLAVAEDNVVVTFVDANQAEAAVYNAGAGTLVITADFSAAGPGATLQGLADAVTAIAEFEAETDTPAGAGAAADAAVTGTTGIATLAISADDAGADFNNMAISIATATGQGAGTPGAVYTADTNTLVITIDDAASTALSAIETAIGNIANANLTAVADTTDGNARVTVSGDTAAADSGATGNTLYTGGGVLLESLVFELSGASGVEVFSFEQYTKISSVVSAVNLVSDSLGVTATDNAGVMEFDASEYGSGKFVSVDVISEGGAGTFETALSATRATGTDIAATVNGYVASGDGNELSLNTATLDMTAMIAAGQTATIQFSITDGGAMFQLGPDVVSNQQARIGIRSVNTARLGSTDGKLRELGSGESYALNTDPTTAASIVDEVISKVASLRGRLGAFQKMTLDTNIRSLNDTLENLVAAESSIRDADFAAESAALTRAQILVQSGVSVLAIANSNPQNVLALLR